MRLGWFRDTPRCCAAWAAHVKASTVMSSACGRHGELLDVGHHVGDGCARWSRRRGREPPERGFELLFLGTVLRCVDGFRHSVGVGHQRVAGCEARPWPGGGAANMPSMKPTPQVGGFMLGMFADANYQATTVDLGLATRWCSTPTE